MDKIAKYMADEAARCVRCGACRSSCTTFNVIYREGASARGKVALIEAEVGADDAIGDVGLGDEYRRHIKECALCGACLSGCPKGVDTPSLVMAARAREVEKDGLGVASSFILKNLLGPTRGLDKAFGMATRLQGLILKDSPADNGLLARFSLPFIGGGRVVPELPPKTFLDTVVARKKPAGVEAGAPKVGFFVGCGVNYLMPTMGEAAMNAIEKAGGVATVPADQACCGMPALSMGEVETARKLALKNLEVFEEGGFDFITTACATCGDSLRNLTPKLLADSGDELRQRAAVMATRVMDITELLGGVFDYKGIEKGPRRRVTYHDPCHLSRSQGIKDEPREIIERSGAELKEMGNPCRCCGLGGGLAYTNYELSMEIARKKAEDIRGTGADIVATACPGCVVQIRDALHRFNVDAKVVHVIELL